MMKKQIQDFTVKELKEYCATTACGECPFTTSGILFEMTKGECPIIKLLSFAYVELEVKE